MPAVEGGSSIKLVLRVPHLPTSRTDGRNRQIHNQDQRFCHFFLSNWGECGQKISKDIGDLNSFSWELNTTDILQIIYPSSAAYFHHQCIQRGHQYRLYYWSKSTEKASEIREDDEDSTQVTNRLPRSASSKQEQSTLSNPDQPVPQTDSVAGGHLAQQSEALAMQACPLKFNAPNPHWGQKTNFKSCPLTSANTPYHGHVPIHNNNKQNKFKYKSGHCTWLL